MASTSSSDTLPSNVPKLEISGTNWPIWRIRFTVAATAKGKFGHFNGTTPRPVPVALPPTQAEAQAMQAWDDAEDVAKYLLTQRIPDSTVMHLESLATVAEMWTTLTTEFAQKGAYAQTDMRTAFLESKCAEGGNVRTWLSDLRTKQEELAAVGVIIDAKDYRSTILSSLPTSLSNFASNVLAAARLTAGPHATIIIDNDALIQLISEEFDRQQTLSKRRKSSKGPNRGRGSGERDDEVLAFTPGHSL